MELESPKTNLKKLNTGKFDVFACSGSDIEENLLL